MEDKSSNQIKYQLREEELDLKKKWVQTGEISWHKENVVEEKSLSIPVKKEELIIEKKFIYPEEQKTRTETMRIPLREERLEITKSTFELEEVEINKHLVQSIEPFDAKLKREIMFINNIENQKDED